MPNGTDAGAGDSRLLSRRKLLKGVGMAGAAAATSVATPGPSQAQHAHAAAAAAPTPQRLEALEALTAAEADTLEAICARLIPSDASGPGAAEARAANYIDRALGGPMSNLRGSYTAGLAAVDAHARTAKGKPFAELSAPDQDAVLTDMEKNVATGFKPNAAAFFNLVRTHTIQGTFCDPYYGGNADFVGWDMLGYPGLRMVVTEDDQRLTKPPIVHQSAYSDPMFAKKGGGHGHNAK